MLFTLHYRLKKRSGGVKVTYYREKTKNINSKNRLTKCLVSNWLLGINVSVPNAKVCPKNKIHVIKTYLLKWHLPIDCIVANRMLFLSWVIMFNAEERNPNTDRSEVVWGKRRWWNRSCDSYQAPQRFCRGEWHYHQLANGKGNWGRDSRTQVIFDYYLCYRNNIFGKTVQHYIISWRCCSTGKVEDG